MNWKTWHRITSYAQSSLWLVPLGALIVEQVFMVILIPIDANLNWSGLSLGVDGARGMVNAIITLLLSFIVFTFGSLLIAIQVASGQYTPRIIATTLLRNNVIRYTVALFVFTLLFAVRAINHIEGSVPQLSVCLIGTLGLVCLAAFLFLIDY